MPKQLYISKNLQDLNSKTKYTYDKTKSIKAQIESANRAFAAARTAFRDQDEERAYVLYMKYLDCITTLRRTYAYKKDEKTYKLLFRLSELNEAIKKAESLSISLENRYKIMQKEEGSQPENNSKEDFLPSLNGHQGKEVTPSVKVEEQKKDILDSFQESIDIYDLYKICFKQDRDIIIMDIRSEDDYLESHIKHRSCISVPRKFITPGAVCSKIEKSLSATTKLVWNSRNEVGLVVLMDWHSNPERLKSFSDPLRSLKDSLWKWEQIKKLKREPLVLKDGYAEFLELYPQFTTNARVKPPSNKPKTSNVNSLLDFSYNNLKLPTAKTEKNNVIDEHPSDKINDTSFDDKKKQISNSSVEKNKVNEKNNVLTSKSSTSSINSRPAIDRSVKPKTQKEVPDIGSLQITKKPLVNYQEKENTLDEFSRIDNERMKAQESTKNLEKEIEELERKKRLIALQRAKEQEESRLLQKKKTEKELADQMRALKKPIEYSKISEEPSEELSNVVQKPAVDKNNKSFAMEEFTGKKRSFSHDSASSDHGRNGPSVSKDSLEDAHSKSNELENSLSIESASFTPGKKVDINELRAKKPQRIVDELAHNNNMPKASTAKHPSSSDAHVNNTPKQRPAVQQNTDSRKPKLKDFDYQESLSDEPRSSSSSLKRSFSSPNVVKLLDQEDMSSMPTIPSRSTKPVLREESSDFIIGLTRALDGVYGGMGRALCGLRNLGNSCYMNSILQCMFNTIELAEYILSNAYRSDINRHNPIGLGGRLAECFSVLLRTVWSGQYKYLVPKDFKAWIGKANDTFADYSQEDAQELLMALIDGLHEDLNRSSKTKKLVEEENENLDDREAAELALFNHSSKNESMLHDLFLGQFKATVQCMHCRKLSKKFDIFLNLSLSMPQRSTTLYDLIQDFEKPEKMTGSNRWYCPQCKTHRDAVKTIKIWKLPQILVVHFKRFVYSGRWRDKIHTNVNFPLNGLDLSNYVCGPQENKVYSLYAVSHHQGAGLDSGHYVASCKSVLDGNWYKFDDTDVYKCAAPQGSTSFVLFYTSNKRLIPRQESIGSR